MGAYEDKLNDRFTTFDHDGDGFITQGDLEEMARGILAEFGVETASSKARALLDGAQQYWSGLATVADRDGDSRISRDEFVQAATQRLRGKPDEFAKVVQPWAEAVITIADTDGDGSVSVVEWERMLRVMGSPPERARSKAEQTDADHDGTVSVQEVLETAVAFYTSEDPIPVFAPAL